MVRCSGVRKADCLVIPACKWEGRCKPKDAKTKTGTKAKPKQVLKPVIAMPYFDEHILAHIVKHVKDDRNLAHLRQTSKTFKGLVPLKGPAVEQAILALLGEMKEKGYNHTVNLYTAGLHLKITSSNDNLVISARFYSGYPGAYEHAPFLQPVEDGVFAIKLPPLSALDLETLFKAEWNRPFTLKRLSKQRHRGNDAYYTIPEKTTCSNVGEYVRLMALVARATKNKKYRSGLINIEITNFLGRWVNAINAYTKETLDRMKPVMQFVTYYHDR